ncbi:MAG: energy transducer TonB [Limisphaerales bacterium]
MNRALVIFYAIAMALHAIILFWLKPPAPRPPKMVERTYVDVALATPPAPAPPKPQPPSPVPQPKVETPPPQPKLESKPKPPPPKAEMTIPTPKPELPPPAPVIIKPTVVPPPKSSQEYVPVTQPNYARRAEPIYPDQARRWHQQGIVTLALFINELGALDKVEIIKSSGFPLLDTAAIKAMKQSRFAPAMDGMIPIRSRAEATVTFRLE